MGLDKEIAEERRMEEIKQIPRVGSRRGWRDGYNEHEHDMSHC